MEPKVTLVRFTPEADALVSSAAKLCYAADASGLLEKGAGDSEKLVSRLLSMGHMSPVEHAVFTFLVEGVSRALTHQLVRHRVASYSQRSQRYVAEDSFDYVIPPSLKGKTVTADGAAVDAEVYFRETMEMLARRYAAINDALGREGETSNEDARYVLPNACETRIMVTMNARELRHFFEERLCFRAQWKIRRLAGIMHSLVSAAAPALFRKAGPKCVRAGKCPEGLMTCGRFDEMRERYA